MSEAPLTQQIYESYQDQGLEVVAFGADWYPDEGSFTCESWASTFGLTYPIANYETGASEFYYESTPHYLYFTDFGPGLPYNVVIDHEMRVVWGSAAPFEGEIMDAAINAIDSSLAAMHESYSGQDLDDDGDGINNDCDLCPRSDLYLPGNIDFSYDAINNESGIVYEPTINIMDLMLMVDMISSSDEIPECYIEANDFSGDGNLNIIDMLALASLILNNI